MKRGEIWTLQDSGYAGKARPVLIVQNDDITQFQSIIVCLLTSFDSSSMPTRILLTPSEPNGLNTISYIMTDKIVTVDRKVLGYRIGTLSPQTMQSVTKQLAVVLKVSYI